MKKLLLITILLFSIFLISCAENIEEPILENSTYSSIMLSFDKSSIPTNILKVDLVLTGTKEFDTTIYIKENPDIVLNWDSLAATTWRLGFTAYDSSNNIMNKGTTIVYVNKGVQSKVVLKDWGRSIAKSPYTWIDLQGPVFGGSKLSLDTFGVTQPNIFYDDGTIKMWYIGLNMGKSHIFYASSIDGKEWVKHPVPVLSPRENEWDSYSLQYPKVIKVNSTYIMYYSSNLKIGMATSTDGINWTRSTEKVKLNGFETLMDPAEVLYVNNTCYLYFVGKNTSSNTNQIFVATSTNGHDFVSVGSILSASFNWEGISLKNPSVFYENGTFKAVYTDNAGVYIGYAESPNGINWTKSQDAVFGYESLYYQWGRSFTGLSFRKIGTEPLIFVSAKIPNENFYKIGFLSKKK